MVRESDRIRLWMTAYFYIKGRRRIYVKFAHTYVKYSGRKLKKLMVWFACGEGK